MRIWTSTDCSEIAGQILDSAGTGSILRAEPAVLGTLRVLENGAVEGEMWYPEAFTDGAYVFDPRMSGSAILCARQVVDGDVRHLRDAHGVGAHPGTAGWASRARSVRATSDAPRRRRGVRAAVRGIVVA